MAKKPSKPQYQTPKYTELSLPELRSTIETFLSQRENLPKTQDFISESAQLRLGALDKLLPGYSEGVAAAQKIASSYAGGNPPSDVAQKVSQSAAFKGLMTGLQGPQRQTIEARDFGQTSSDFQMRGLALQQALRAEANAQMPLQALNLAFSPQAIRSEDVTLAEYNNKIKNQQAEANANTYNRQQDANYEYDSKYGGSPFGSLLGGTLGAGLGAGIGFLASGGNPMGALTGGGLGMSLGGGVGGSFGGGQGMTMGGILGGAGGMISNFGGAFARSPSGWGGFDSVGQAMMAAPYASSYTPYQGGFVPRAEPVSATNPYLPGFRSSGNDVRLRP